MNENSNLINLEIVSEDGKVISLQVEDIYVQIKGYGIMGFLKDCAPFIGIIDISSFYVSLNRKKKYFAISGGIIDVRKDKTIILADTFESEDEIDKDRAQKEKDNALNKMKEIEKSDEFTYKTLEFSLKKAINRLNLNK
jgi:F-type H+-transporting ATPase subunit epsilon